MNQLDIDIQLGKILLQGYLNIPEGAHGIVLFAHGSGSSRNSPRNQAVAKVLNQDGLATMLMDLLTSSEEGIDQETRQLRFDISFLADRLIQSIDWLQKNPETRKLMIGLFGSSTGAAAAIVAAAKKGTAVKAVVSRGGRTDLAGSALPLVKASTLFIVGGDDHGVIELNQDAYQMLTCERKLEIVPHATHLFEESGTLEIVAHLASDWFQKHL